MADNSNNLSEVMSSIFGSMNGFISTKTVVGDITKVGDTVIVPLVDVSFGAGGGAGSKGCASGIHGKMSPSAVLVIRPDGSTKLVNVKNQDTMTKLLDVVPDLIEKVTGKKKDGDLSDEEAKGAAFPEE